MAERASEASETVLAVKGLRCGYGRTDVIHNLDLEVVRGEIVCLIGANGAGKSTVIKAIVGLIPAVSGSIGLCGRDVTALRTSTRVELGLAVVPEGRGVLPQLTVAENLLLGGYVRRSESWLDEEMERVLALFPILKERCDQLAGTLSGGEQQMLVIGRALMSRPRLLILDEPSFGLAPKIIDKIFEAVTELRARGLTILLVEQNANVALEVSQRGYVLESGHCILSDAATTLRNNTMVRDIYFGSG
jgi:branched-chain amino acid transport system ATP-binding protein